MSPAPPSAVVCCFSSLDDLFPIGRRGRKRRCDITATDVLRVLAKVRRFSAFEHQDALNWIMRLKRDGLIALDSERHAFPWTAVELTDKGRAVAGVTAGAEAEGKR